VVLLEFGRKGREEVVLTVYFIAAPRTLRELFTAQEQQILTMNARCLDMVTNGAYEKGGVVLIVYFISMDQLSLTTHAGNVGLLVAPWDGVVGRMVTHIGYIEHLAHLVQKAGVMEKGIAINGKA